MVLHLMSLEAHIAAVRGVIQVVTHAAAFAAIHGADLGPIHMGDLAIGVASRRKGTSIFQGGAMGDSRVNRLLPGQVLELESLCSLRLVTSQVAMSVNGLLHSA